MIVKLDSHVLEICHDKLFCQKEGKRSAPLPPYSISSLSTPLGSLAVVPNSLFVYLELPAEEAKLKGF